MGAWWRVAVPTTALLSCALVLTLPETGAGASGPGRAAAGAAGPAPAPAEPTPAAPAPARAAEVAERGPAAATPDRGLALYVWDAADPDVVAFARAHGVTHLLVAVPPDVTSAPVLDALRTLVADAHAHGIAVDALGGDPGWVDRPAWVVRHWLRPVLATGLFDGVHLDVEPYVTPAWETDRRAVVARYVAAVERIAAAAGDVRVEADIPFWFDGVRGVTERRLDEQVMGVVDGVTVMAYRHRPDGPDGTLALAAATVASAGELGVPVRVGQLTTDLGDSPVDRKQTHAGTSPEAMAAAFAVVDAALADAPTYLGIAVHDLDGWRALED